MAPKNPGLNKSFLDDTPSDMTEHHPNAYLYAGDSEMYALGGTATSNGNDGTPSAPPGVMDATTAQSARRHFTVSDVAHTPSMDGPAATRPMKATDRALPPSEAPQSSD